MTPDEARDEVTFWTAEVALLRRAQAQAENDLLATETELYYAMGELQAAETRVREL